MKFRFFHTVLFCCLFINVRAADVKNILPITNKILAIEFDEGHIDYFGKYQDRYDGNKLYYKLLDTKKTEKDLPVFSRQIHAECHPVILSEMKDEPVSNHIGFLTDLHIGFDQDLKKLINGQDYENN